MKFALGGIGFNRQILLANLILAFSAFVLNCFHNNAFAQSPPEPIIKSNLSAADQKQSNSSEQGESSKIKVYVLRLKPGQDLRKEIEKFAGEKGIKAGFIITTVGSLEKTTLRLADQNDSAVFDGKFEIVSLVGTISTDGVHLHLSVSNSTGRTVGGHLVEGCRIYTTAEIVIGEAVKLSFSRETERLTGYKELVIRSKPARRKNTAKIKKARE